MDQDASQTSPETVKRRGEVGGARQAKKIAGIQKRFLLPADGPQYIDPLSYVGTGSLAEYTVSDQLELISPSEKRYRLLEAADSSYVRPPKRSAPAPPLVESTSLLPASYPALAQWLHHLGSPAIRR